MTDLSIIIPVFQVEKYVHQCLESVFKQGLDDAHFEVIIVNDGTEDRSIEVIQDIIAQHNNVTVINQPNQGLSAARNNGMTIAKGSHVLFVDSDDLLIDGALKPLLDCALSTSADMVMGSFIKMNGEQIESYVPDTSSPQDIEPIVMSGEEAFVNFLNPRQCYVWRTLYRRDFLQNNGIKFIPDIYFEDVPYTSECYSKAKKCVSFPISFYIYRQRSNSIVSSINKKKIIDFNIIIENLWHLKESYSVNDNMSKKLEDVIFSTFSIEMWYLSSNKEVYRHKKEVVNDLKSRVPDLHFSNSKKQKLFSFLFRHIPYTYLRSRYFYGKIVEDRVIPFYRHHIVTKK